MKRFSKISGMTIVTCDHVNAQRYPGEPRTCGIEFRSCSDKSVIDKQLDLAQWEIIPSAMGDKHHCPDHNEGARRAAHAIDKTFLPMKG